MGGYKELNSVQGLNSLERRHELRYQRRKLRREEHRREVNKDYSDYDKVFSFRHLYKSYKKCIRGVKWKNSVDRFRCKWLKNLFRVFRSLKRRRPRIGKPYKFTVFERGKKRDIQSIEIRERISRKCLCDYSIVPALSNSFIYDNGASLKGKGTSFSLNRVKQMIADFLRHYDSGYIIMFDFKGYFKNIWHKEVHSQLARVVFSDDIKDLVRKYTDEYTEEKDEELKRGLGLGGQDSQVLALSAANRLDHFIKDILGIKYYERYMDDGWILCRTLAECKEVLEKIRRKCEEYNIILNESKTYIQPLLKPFVYLKKKFHISRTKKLSLTIHRSSVVRMRRKLKKFYDLVNIGKITWKEVWQSLQSWLGCIKHFKAHKCRRSIYRLYNKLFIRSGWCGLCID